MNNKNKPKDVGTILNRLSEEGLDYVCKHFTKKDLISALEELREDYSDAFSKKKQMQTEIIIFYLKNHKKLKSLGEELLAISSIAATPQNVRK